MDMHSEHEHTKFSCDGSVVTRSGGSWEGHILPGAIFILWGLHHMLGIFRTYVNSHRSKKPEFISQPYYQFFSLPLMTESWFKILLPPLAVSVELYWAHDAYRRLVCSAGTVRHGHINGDTLNNWQHTAIYPGFVAAGIIDLVSQHVALPSGTSKAFVALAFLNETILMLLHKKHTPLDIAVHLMLGYTMLSSFIFTILEIARPRSFLISCGRVFSLFLQGTWLCAAGRILFENRPFWDEMGGEDTAPAMYIPVLYCFHILGVAFTMAMSYVGFLVYYTRRHSDIEFPRRATSDSEHAALLELESIHAYHRESFDRGCKACDAC